MCRKEDELMKIVVAIVMFFCVSGILNAGQDRYGNVRTSAWRSSFTATADRNFSISTAAVIFWDVVVGSPSPNSLITIYDSSSTVFTTALTTVARIATDVRNHGNPYNIYLSSGLMFNKIGTADITILWDYINPFNK